LTWCAARSFAWTTITGVAAPADIAYDSKRGRLWIPLFTGDALDT